MSFSLSLSLSLARPSSRGINARVSLHRDSACRKLSSSLPSSDVQRFRKSTKTRDSRSMIATGERRHFRGEASPCVSGRRLRRRDRPASFRSLSEKTARREGTFNFRPPPISWAPPLDGRHESLFLDGLPLRRSCCYPPNLPLAGDPCAPYIISSLMHVTGTPRSLTRVNGLRVRPVSSTRSAGFLRDRGRSQIGGRADRDRRAGAPRSRLGISSNASRRDAIGSKRYETQENRSNRSGGGLLAAAERRNPFRLHEKSSLRKGSKRSRSCSTLVAEERERHRAAGSIFRRDSPMDLEDWSESRSAEN